MTMTKQVTVFLADDHAMILPGIKMAVESQAGFSVVGQATDGQAAYAGIVEARPDIAVLDLSIPLLSGFEIIARLRREDCRTRFIILTSYSDDKYIKEALELKVDGYILKENSSAELLAALEAVSKGLKYMTPRVMTRIVQGLETSGDRSGAAVALDSLTPRERELLRLVADAKTGKEICTLMGIGESTMKVHKTNVMRKLGLRTSGEMQLYARKNAFCFD